MKRVKISIVFLLILIMSWALYIKLTTEPKTYICASNDSSLSITIYENYPWQRLLSSNDGRINVKLSNEEVLELYYKLEKNSSMKIYDKKTSIQKGEYSSIKNLLSLNMQKKTFEGSCSICKDYCINGILH